jgi:hypothetical protein
VNTDAIRQWVANQTGLTTVWLHPDAPRPDKPYATVQVLSSPDIGLPYTSKPDPEGQGTIRVQREVTVSVQVYEEVSNPDPRSAYLRAIDLRDSLYLPSVRDSLAVDGWGLRGIELLADTPQQVGDGWEPRATFDARFGVAVDLTDDLGLIETAEITGTVESGDDSTTDTYTVE